jgi:3-oxoacyl-[acyl-carrier-protein] synthase-1
MPAIPVIGMGTVCSAGYGVHTGFAAVSEGKDGCVPLSVLDTGLKQTPLCGEVKERSQETLEAPNATTGFALHAAREACEKLPQNHGLRLGLVLATTVAGMTRSEQFYRTLRENADVVRQAAGILAFHEPTAVSGVVAARINACGFHTISTACSTGLHAVGMAKRLIEHDVYDLCCAVGADALSLLTVRGFARLMLIDFDGCKPFDKRRVGISLGEGAGALLLASAAAQEKLGIEPAGYVAGWGASADGYHMTAPHPEGRGARRAVEKALEEAQVAPEDIGFIAAHGTATPDNDVAEIKAMQSIFSKLPPFGSMKRSLGHTLAASGALEAVFALQAMQESIILPTAGFEQTDDAIGIAPSAKKQADMRHVLKNSFGFGGNNAAVVFSRDKNV